MSVDSATRITTTEMHTGGEPLRIVETGFPEIKGKTILEKRQYVKENFDHFRRFLMHEPRGHYDMYGALLVKPDHPDADLGVLFIHNAGYSTMCGHAVLALGRYAIDKGFVKAEPSSAEVQVNIQCPCGLIPAFVDYNNGKSGGVRFHSVPAFAFDLDVKVEVPEYGKLLVDIGYGGAFYALVSGERFGLDIRTCSTHDIVKVAASITDAAQHQVKLYHPDSQDLAFLYGTIVTDGRDSFQNEPTANICVFAEKEVDRSPTGSGVTARIAVQYKRGLINLGQQRVFESAVNGSKFTGKAIRKATCGQFDAVIVEVSGKGHYTGSATYIVEDDDPHKDGFLLR